MEIKLDLEDILAQIEDEFNWRILELQQLKNNLSYLENENNEKVYRKALVVMLYSYFEGFTKAAFNIYVDSLNKLNLNRAFFNENLQASSMQGIFYEYHNEEKKEKHFKKELPEDGKLHRYARQISFLEALHHFKQEKLILPEKIVDTEANLKPVVLRKILYRLGFNYEEFKQYEGNINKLLNRRNSISHGSQKQGIEATEYNDVERDVLQIMDELRLMIFDSLVKKKYLRERELEFMI